MNNEENDFDLFAEPKDDHLQAELDKGSYQWTNKYTKVLAGLVIVTAALSAGAWYGHRSATNVSSGATLRNGLAGFGVANFGGQGFGGGLGSRNRNSATGASNGATGGFGGGGFGGPRVTGTVANVSGNKVTITLDDPTQASNLKVGDSTRVTDVTALTGGAPAQLPGATTSGNKSSSAPKTSSTTGGTSTSRPSIGGQGTQGGGQRGGGFGGGGGFNNPEFAACLKNEGVELTPGTRPDRSDPKVAAALTKCFQSLGFGNRGGSGAPAPSAAPSN